MRHHPPPRFLRRSGDAIVRPSQASSLQLPQPVVESWPHGPAASAPGVVSPISGSRFWKRVLTVPAPRLQTNSDLTDSECNLIHPAEAETHGLSAALTFQFLASIRSRAAGLV